MPLDAPPRLTEAPQGYADWLAQDLRSAFPEMKGFSSRNLKYMRAFALAWPDLKFVQATLAQLPWYHHLALRDRSQPIGVAEYQLIASLPEKLQTSLPSIEQIERELTLTDMTL